MLIAAFALIDCVMGDITDRNINPITYFLALAGLVLLGYSVYIGNISLLVAIGCVISYFIIGFANCVAWWKSLIRYETSRYNETLERINNDATSMTPKKAKEQMVSNLNIRSNGKMKTLKVYLLLWPFSGIGSVIQTLVVIVSNAFNQMSVDAINRVVSKASMQEQQELK